MRTRGDWRFVALFGVMALLFGLAGPVRGAEPAQLAPPTCSSGWTYKVSHSWWTEKGEAFPGRHIHLGACVPSHVRVSGSSITVDARITLHGNPGTVKWVRGCWNSSCADSAYNRSSFSCTATCTVTRRLTIPLGGRTGWYELRLSANIDPNRFGDRQFESTRYAVPINTSAAQPSSGEGGRTGMAGWYHDHYQNVYVDEATAKRLEAGPITLPFTFKAKGDKARTIVAIDANSHANDPGLQLGTTSSTSFQSYTIPAGSLASGWHALFVRTEETFSDGVSAGQGEFPFRVN